MKFRYEKKQKMSTQRFRRMKDYFRLYGRGDMIILETDMHKRMPESYFILSSCELGGEFYYVLGANDGNIFIGKVVYSGCAGVIEVSKESRKYKENKDVFESWIKSAKDSRERNIRKYYNAFGMVHKGVTIPERIIVYYNRKIVDANFSLKKEFDGKYYFVVSLSSENYAIAKIAWAEYSVRPVVLTEKEFAENKEEFEAWIAEAKKKDKKEENHG